MEFRPRTTENDGICYLRRSTRHTSPRVVLRVCTDQRAGRTGESCFPPRLPGLHPARTRSSLETTQSDCLGTENRSWGFTFSNDFFFFFLVIFITVLKYCLAYRISSRSVRTRQWVWLGFCTYETLQCLCADRDLPVCLRCILSLHLTLTSVFCSNYFA